MLVGRPLEVCPGPAGKCFDGADERIAVFVVTQDTVYMRHLHVTCVTLAPLNRPDVDQVRSKQRGPSGVLQAAAQFGI